MNNHLSKPIELPPVLIGSKALSFYTDIAIKDIDILSISRPSIDNPSSLRVEYHWDDSFLPVIEQAITLNQRLDGVLVPSLNHLFTIKVSHIPFNKMKWKRHLEHIWLMRDIGAVLDMNLYKELWSLWEQRFSSRQHINLNKDLDSFFNLSPQHKDNHEQLHQLVAYYDSPIHTKVRRNKDKALCSEDLFDALPFEDKVKLAVEEVIVISIERAINYKRAYNALVMGMTRGWFNIFLIIYGDKILVEAENRMEYLHTSNVFQFKSIIGPRVCI